MKATFSHNCEWNDYSEHSPTHRGQLPVAVEVPGGTIVEISEDAIIAQGFYAISRAGYVDMGHGVRTRLTGSDPTPFNCTHGSSWSKLEVLAPKGSKFIFHFLCSICGEANGRGEMPEGQNRMLARDHQECLDRVAWENAQMEEMRRENRAAQKRLDEEWERNYGHLVG